MSRIILPLHVNVTWLLRTLAFPFSSSLGVIHLIFQLPLLHTSYIVLFCLTLYVHAKLLVSSFCSVFISFTPHHVSYSILPLYPVPFISCLIFLIAYHVNYSIMLSFLFHFHSPPLHATLTMILFLSISIPSFSSHLSFSFQSFQFHHSLDTITYSISTRSYSTHLQRTLRNSSLPLPHFPG